MPKRKSGSTSGKSGAGKTSPTNSGNTAPSALDTPSGDKLDTPSRDKLESWLNEQATKLKALTTNGHRLKLDFVQNARDKGTLLLEVEKRVSHIPARFQVWVTTGGGIGYSTALLYMDVAKNYDAVKERFANSNPLELTLRQVRNAIRDARQEEGGGKPGSGRRKDTDDATPPTAEEGDEAAIETEVAHSADAGNENDAAAVSDKKFDKLMSRAQPGGDMHNDGGTPKAIQPDFYRLTVVTPAKADLEKFGDVLPSPTTDFNAHSVSGRISLPDIIEALAKVGRTLSTTQPKKVRIIVEL